MLALGTELVREREFQAAAAFEDFQQSELVFARERAERSYGDIVDTKLDLLDEYLGRLRSLARVTPEVYSSDWMTRCAVDRMLELAIGVCISLARHMVADRGLRTPTTYAETFAILRDAGLVEPAFANTLARMCGFRNRLAHDQALLDPIMVVDVLRNHVDDLARFGEAVRGQRER